MSEAKKETVLVLADGFKMYLFIRAVANTKTEPGYLNEIIIGVPLRLICDRGSAFTSQAFTEHWLFFGIKKVLCVTATPRENGQV